MSKLKKCCKFERKWEEQPPGFPHRYKVTCNLCKTFIKWGSEREAKMNEAYSRTDFFQGYKKPNPLPF